MQQVGDCLPRHRRAAIEVHVAQQPAPLGDPCHCRARDLAAARQVQQPQRRAELPNLLHSRPPKPTLPLQPDLLHLTPVLHDQGPQVAVQEGEGARVVGDMELSGRGGANAAGGAGHGWGVLSVHPLLVLRQASGEGGGGRGGVCEERGSHPLPLPHEVVLHRRLPERRVVDTRELRGDHPNPVQPHNLIQWGGGMVRVSVEILLFAAGLDGLVPQVELAGHAQFGLQTVGLCRDLGFCFGIISIHLLLFLLPNNLKLSCLGIIPHLRRLETVFGLLFQVLQLRF
mmetsp:Transcript_52718/g.94119  ORF Transcript_52718/g.94119 Transcript_52718/m.94119 type:complete len:285 (+) Transcript_52718:2249-3103(+)